MTHIVDLINSVKPLIPFPDAPTAQSFLDQYLHDDQCALISALYLGEEHKKWSQMFGQIY